MHHDSMLIKSSNIVQQYAEIYLLQGPDQATLEGSSRTNIMTYTRGSGYSF